MTSQWRVAHEWRDFTSNLSLPHEGIYVSRGQCATMRQYAHFCLLLDITSSSVENMKRDSGALHQDAKVGDE